jgi:hypothetical protein
MAIGKLLNTPTINGGAQGGKPMIHDGTKSHRLGLASGLELGMMYPPPILPGYIIPSLFDNQKTTCHEGGISWF